MLDLDPASVISFHVSIRIPMSEFDTWEPEQIKALFDGMAQLLAASNHANSELRGDGD